MKTTCWIIVNSRGATYTRKNKPQLKANEVPVKVELNVPDELFERPALQASISVPSESYMQKPITAEVRDNVQEAIEQATEMQFDVTLVHNREENDEAI